MATDSEVRAWAELTGQTVDGQGPNERGRLAGVWHRRYDEAHGGPVVMALAPPSAFDGGEIAEDLGIIDIGDPPQDSPTESSTSGPGGTPPQPPGPPPDEAPGHSRREWRDRRTRAPRSKAPAGKLTAGIRGDINAKISLMLEVPGQIWAARDPVCGGTFVQQRPDIAGALTDIVCESADLIAFFTGPAGGFMRYLNLAVAVFPVGQAIMAHHVYHTVEIGEEAAEPDMGQYAA